MSAQAREMKAVVGQPASVIGAPGPRDPGAHGAAVDVDSTRLRGGEEEGRGCWQSAPRGQTLSLALTGQFLQMEGGFHTLCWFQLTVFARLFASHAGLKTDICSPFPTSQGHYCHYKSTQLYFVCADGQNFISNVY